MEESTAPRASLIVSTTDNPDALNLVLESVGLQTSSPREVLIADHSTDDQTATVSKNWSQRLSCRVEHFWPPRDSNSRVPVLNHAVRAATGDYLIFIEGDCLLHRLFISDHLRHAKPGTFVQGRRAGIRARYVRRVTPRSFHPIIWFLRRRSYGLRAGLRRPWPEIRFNDRRMIHGCNFAVWRHDLIRVNGFDEAFEENGFEFVELAERLCNAGLALRTITGQAIVYHLDHRYVARYGTAANERIVETTRREQRTSCERGLVPGRPVERGPVTEVHLRSHHSSSTT